MMFWPEREVLWIFIDAGGFLIYRNHRGMYIFVVVCLWLATMFVHLLFIIFFAIYVLSLSGPNDDSPIYTACYTRR